MEQGSALKLGRKRAYQHHPISLVRFSAFEAAKKQWQL
jgi:hypothetical protein